MAKQRRPKRHSPWWARICVALGCLIMVISGTALAGMKILVGRYTGSITQDTLLGSEALAQGKSINGAINMLLIGTDERTGQKDDKGIRSDSILVLHIPATHDHAYLLSIPRDTRVQIPAFPKTGFRGMTAKINAAFDAGYDNGGGKSGGFQLLSSTVAKLTGLTFNGGVIVNFSSFEKIVDALGGVDMYVDTKVTSIHVGWDKNGKSAVPYKLSAPAFDNPTRVPGVTPKVYEVGDHHFQGWEALDYARQRDLVDGGDYARQRHQQQFIKALAKKAADTGLTDFHRLDALLLSIGSALTFDGGQVNVVDWVFTLKGLNPANVVMIKANGGKFNPQTIDGQSFEIMDDTTKGAFTAMKTDQVAGYLLQHADIVGT